MNKGVRTFLATVVIALVALFLLNSLSGLGGLTTQRLVWEQWEFEKSVKEKAVNTAEWQGTSIEG